MEPMFALVLTLLTPQGQPDQTKIYPMATLEQCWEKAHEAMKADVPKGLRGIVAGCGKEMKPGHNA